jgi:Rrf2 family nitric oxide-sensitive transcriptional repressor
MLTRTSRTAIRALVAMAREGRDLPTSPARIAEQVGASPSYMAKINTLLVKADILATCRGRGGGVHLNRAPQGISLLEVVEACQGKILADYCQEHPRLGQVCAYHKAMHELQRAIVGTLGRWTLEDMAAKPAPSASLRGVVPCVMAPARGGGPTRGVSRPRT